jgi:acyl-ACP thioesterase
MSPASSQTTSPAEDAPPIPRQGRIYRTEVRAGLADASPSGRVRLDAIARWLQDIAWDDVVEAGVSGEGTWIARRTRIAVARFPQFWERLDVSSWCNGIGRLCVERHTALLGDQGAKVVADTVWVQLRRDNGVPCRIDDDFRAVFAPSANGRRVNGRLHHPPPPASAGADRWTLRFSDLDLAGHVNNSVHWQVLEEALGGAIDPDGALEAEIEYRSPAHRGALVVIRKDSMTWMLSEEGELLASAVFRHPESPTERRSIG